MYTALYRTERPETFDQVLGQDHIVRILKNQVKTGTVGHAYLFCGTRGTGKTSVARILAKAVNCTGEGEKPCGECPNCRAIQNGNFLDVIEIDAASNNGVDSVRELRESVNYPPSIGRRKVYIIDEAHELTTHALNALLKTLEEPPEGVMFILATTDPQKLIQTILSRCLRLDFHRISEGDLKGHMKNICDKRGVEITDEALNLLTSNADGSARDGLSLLDQCLSGGDKFLDRDLVLDYLGAVSDDFYIRLTDCIIEGDVSSALVLLDEVLREGKDVKQVLAGLVGHYRSLLVGQFVENPESMLNMSKENVDRLVIQAKSIPLEEINRSIMVLANAVNNARYSTQPRILTELAIVTLASGTEAKENAVPKARIVPVKKNFQDKPPVESEQDKPPVKVAEEKPQAPAPDKRTAAAESVPEEMARDNGAEGNTDLEDLWSQVWDKIDDLGSVTMVRINSSLAGLSQSDFKVLITGGVSMMIAEKNRDILEEAMSQVVGRPLKMVLKEGEAKKNAVQESFFTSEENREEESLWDEMDADATRVEWDEESEDSLDESLKEEIESKLNISVRVED